MSHVERNSSRGFSRRHNPYERPSQGRIDEPPRAKRPPPDELPNSIKVGASLDARVLSRQICEACRRGEDLPTLLSIGLNSINQAVKGIAIARHDLRVDKMDIAFQPAFRHEDRTRPLIAFYLTRSTYREGVEEAGELSVGSNSKIVSVAGALSGRIRDGQKVYLSAIGVNAVSTAVMSCANGRLFLEEDSKDIRVQPEFVKVQKMEQVLNTLRFNFLVENI